MKLKFNVTGMTCAACSARVEKVTRTVPGVERAEVNLLAGTMAVEAADPAAAEKIIAAVSAAGYGASLPGEKKEPTLPDSGLFPWGKPNYPETPSSGSPRKPPWTSS